MRSTISLRLTFTALLPLAFLPGTMAGQESLGEPAALNDEQWREDLEVLATEVPQRHLNFFQNASRDEYERNLAALDTQLSDLQRHEIIVEMARIVNPVVDGHSGIRLHSDEAIGFRSYPIKLMILEEGAFVEAADARYADIVGGRLLRIGNQTIEQALETVAPLIARDNDQHVKTIGAIYLIIPEVLDATGIVTEMEAARFTVDKAGREISVDVSPVESFVMPSHQPIDPRLEGTGWVSALADTDGPMPLWMRQPDANFWFELLPENLLYVQINRIRNAENETLAEFATRMGAFARENDVDRLVIDLRWNRGGNNQLNPPLVRELIKIESVDRPGGLFVVIGPTTFSAAQNLVNDLERLTNAVFVGEPTGSNVNQYGDPARVRLPNSGITVRASTLWWQHHPLDERRWTPPDFAVELTFADYVANRDPVMELIIGLENVEIAPDLGQILSDAFDSGGFEAAVAAYHQYKDNPAYAYVDTEPVINQAGYSLIELGMIDEAIQVFEMNVEAYPDSWNVYDSLAEAYLERGDYDEAIAYYEKSLQINPENRNGVEMLARIRDEQRARGVEVAAPAER